MMSSNSSKSSRITQLKASAAPLKAPPSSPDSWLTTTDDCHGIVATANPQNNKTQIESIISPYIQPPYIQQQLIQELVLASQQTEQQQQRKQQQQQQQQPTHQQYQSQPRMSMLQMKHQAAATPAPLLSAMSQSSFPIPMYYHQNNDATSSFQASLNQSRMTSPLLSAVTAVPPSSTNNDPSAPESPLLQPQPTLFMSQQVSTTMMLDNDAQPITLQHQLTSLEATIIQALCRKELRAVARNNLNFNAIGIPQGETPSTNRFASSSMAAASTSTNRTSSPTMTVPNAMSTSSTTTGSPKACFPLSSPSQNPDTPLTYNSTDRTQLPGHSDVLLGRGSKINMHPGNMKFRQLVAQRQQLYRSVPKFEKVSIAQNVVAKIQEQGGRFLRSYNGEWSEVPRQRAIEKASQALRERS